ncbi:MAG: COG4315 family predicted lipoprotein [Anaerolineae bacterium]
MLDMGKTGRILSLGTIAAVVLFLSVVAVAQATTVQIVNNADLGMILADADGMTLYTFTNDTAGQPSTCVDTCATNWPPLTIASGDPVAPAGLPGTLSTIARADGALQVAHDGMPLYRYVNDTAAGQTNGQGVNNVWYVVVVQAAGTGTPGTGTPAAEATTAATTAATAEATTAATEVATAAATTAATVAAQAATTTPAATAVAGATGTATPQQALPTTGAGGGSWTLTVIVLGGLALLAGAGLSVALQRRNTA